MLYCSNSELKFSSSCEHNLTISFNSSIPTSIDKLYNTKNRSWSTRTNISTGLLHAAEKDEKTERADDQDPADEQDLPEAGSDAESDSLGHSINTNFTALPGTPDNALTDRDHELPWAQFLQELSWSKADLIRHSSFI